MGICRDICNGYKHKKLNYAKYDPDFNLYREYDHFKAEASPSENPENYYITIEYEGKIKKYDIFKLINKCIKIWNQFIKYNILEAGNNEC